MKTWEKIAIVGGSIAAIGGLVLAFQKSSFNLSGNGSYILQTIATPQAGGSINPNSESGASYPFGTVVTITATPAAGYTVGDWTIDSIDQHSSASSVTVTMNTDHEVAVTFYLGGEPPVSSAPYSLAATKTTEQVFGYIGAVCSAESIAGHAPGTKELQEIYVNYTDANWNWGQVAGYPVQFLVSDENGRPVPNTTINVWVDTQPDTSKYSGWLVLKGINGWQMNCTSSNPVQITTGPDGVATAYAAYFYGINDNYAEICSDAQLFCWIWEGIVYTGIPVHNGSKPGGANTISKVGGDQYTGQWLYPSQTAMIPFVTNYIHAQVSNTSIAQAMTIIQCGFHVKMLPIMVGQMPSVPTVTITI